LRQKGLLQLILQQDKMPISVDPQMRDGLKTI